MSCQECFKVKRKPHKWTKEEIDYLKEICTGRNRNEITKMLTEKFEYDFSVTQIKLAMKKKGFKTGLDGRFKKGCVPANKGTKGIMKANKTSFKKGCVPTNKKQIGSERVNVEGYTEIKVKEPNKWRLKHRVLYEKYNGVKLNPKQIIIFGDRNKNNFEKDNLILVNNEQLLYMNKNGLIKSGSELTKIGVDIAKIILKCNKIEKEQKGEK